MSPPTKADGATQISLLNFCRDRLKMRDVEMCLAADLHSAHERWRLLKLRIRDVESTIDPSALNDGLSIKELQARHLEATATEGRALQRFVDFVTKGVVPEDLNHLISVPDPVVHAQAH
jgi:hypothetical protein